MPYTLFTDKSTLFECVMELEGVSLKETVARLIVEAPDRTFLFTGTVSPDGTCSIPISKLKGLLESDIRGTIKLEVIAEDMFFSPWQSDFIVETAKKVTINEVNFPSTEKKPSVRVQIRTPIDPAKKITEEIATHLKANGITASNATMKKQYVRQIIEEHLNRVNYKGNRSEIIPSVVKLLAQ
jgi:hypothetical protein